MQVKHLNSRVRWVCQRVPAISDFVSTSETKRCCQVNVTPPASHVYHNIRSCHCLHSLQTCRTWSCFSTASYSSGIVTFCKATATAAIIACLTLVSILVAHVSQQASRQAGRQASKQGLTDNQSIDSESMSRQSSKSSVITCLPTQCLFELPPGRPACAVQCYMGSCGAIPLQNQFMTCTHQDT